MSEDNTLIKKRFAELSQRSLKRNSYEQTDFLTMYEQSVVMQMANAGIITSPLFFGGLPDAERNIAVFGNAEDCGYEYVPEIDIVKITPRSEKFGEQLSHRDCLGALLSLGIKRETLGDIMFDGKTAYAAAEHTVSGYIIDNLQKIKHTDVKCAVTDGIPDILKKEPTEKLLFAASERADCIAAAVFSLSRNAAKEYFAGERVFINGKLTESPSAELTDGDIVSVRGLGRFIYYGVNKTTKKGRLCVRVGLFQ